ncbi:hypothetical protein BTT_55220 [Bacillus thuringiensis serovar morrisoni str. 4AA1]|nr:hypothetical protein BTT_55220 [Bacillus thuringiensis serovar morrisoni str. 4AA1]SPT89564.1 Uncharacterised protein [Bacillus cereus]
MDQPTVIALCAIFTVVLGIVSLATNILIAFMNSKNSKKE